MKKDVNTMSLLEVMIQEDDKSIIVTLRREYGVEVLVGARISAMPGEVLYKGVTYNIGFPDSMRPVGERLGIPSQEYVDITLVRESKGNAVTLTYCTGGQVTKLFGLPSDPSGDEIKVKTQFLLEELELVLT